MNAQAWSIDFGPIIVVIVAALGAVGLFIVCARDAANMRKRDEDASK